MQTVNILEPNVALVAANLDPEYFETSLSTRKRFDIYRALSIMTKTCNFSRGACSFINLSISLSFITSSSFQVTYRIVGGNEQKLFKLISTPQGAEIRINGGYNCPRCSFIKPSLAS